jgi:hypothetical protein
MSFKAMLLSSTAVAVPLIVYPVAESCQLVKLKVPVSTNGPEEGSAVLEYATSSFPPVGCEISSLYV